jgi:hypothetical protein
MRVVEVVPDDTMIVPGYEHHTLECPGCHEVERRLLFGRELEPVEPKALPSELDQGGSVTAPNVIPAASSAPSAAAAPSVAAPSAWERAIDRLRSQQSYLEERQAEARSAEAIGRFHRDWDNLVHSPRPSDAIVAPPLPVVPPAAKISKVSKPISFSKFTHVSKSTDISKPNVSKPNVSKPNVSKPNVSKPNVGRPNVAKLNVANSAVVSKSFSRSTTPASSIGSSAKDVRAQLRTAPSSVMARTIARLPKHTAALQPIDRNSDDSKRFDEMWESFAPRPERPAPAPSSSQPRPQPAPAPPSQPVSQSRSLVPVVELGASSAWARAMLRARR